MTRSQPAICAELDTPDLLVDGIDHDRQLAAVLEREYRPLAGEQPIRAAEAVPACIGDRPYPAALRRQVSVALHSAAPHPHSCRPAAAYVSKLRHVNMRLCGEPVSPERAEAIRQGVG
jgi:hypothetical protein